MQGEIMPTNQEESPLAVTGGERDAMATATTRAAEEVKAAMVIAKKFPRDYKASRERIMKACTRAALAEKAVYEYPKGGIMVDGPSIRLAEVMATNWGNVDFGITELAQDNESSVVMTYCHDLETNVRQVKTFTVPHLRYKRSGSVKLTDPRDIYEMVANQGARRLRACILGIIPGDIQEEAVQECDKTILAQSDKPLGEQITAAIDAFSKVGVTEAMLTDKLGVKQLRAITHRQVARLRRIYHSIADGIASIKAHFPRVNPEAEKRAEDLRAKMAKGLKVQPEAKTAAKPKKATEAAPKPTPPAEPILEPGERLHPETGEILTDEPQGPDDYDQEPAEEEAPSNPMNEREQLVAQYLDLCEAADQKPKSVTNMSNEALEGHIEALKGN